MNGLLPVTEKYITFQIEIERFPWRFAKTYKDTHPHEYILKKDITNAFFNLLHDTIKEHGINEAWYQQTYRVLFIGRHKYWIMDEDKEKSILINRTCVDGYPSKG